MKPTTVFESDSYKIIETTGSDEPSDRLYKIYIKEEDAFGSVYCEHVSDVNYITCSATFELLEDRRK